MTIQGISFAGINSLGTLMNGTGFGDYGSTIGGILGSNSLFAKILEMHSSVASNTVSVDDVSFDDTTDISPSVIFTLRELGNNREFGSGAFTAVYQALTPAPWELDCYMMQCKHTPVYCLAEVRYTWHKPFKTPQVLLKTVVLFNLY